jgi:hypothetical protein
MHASLQAQGSKHCAQSGDANGDAHRTVDANSYSSIFRTGPGEPARAFGTKSPHKILEIRLFIIFNNKMFIQFIYLIRTSGNIQHIILLQDLLPLYFLDKFAIPVDCQYSHTIFFT